MLQAFRDNLGNGPQGGARGKKFEGVMQRQSLLYRAYGGSRVWSRLFYKFEALS